MIIILQNGEKTSDNYCKYAVSEVPTTKTEYRLSWGLPVSSVSATLGIPRGYSSLKTMMVLPVPRRFETRSLLPYTRVYPGSYPPPAGSFLISVAYNTTWIYCSRHISQQCSFPELLPSFGKSRTSTSELACLYTSQSGGSTTNNMIQQWLATSGKMSKTQVPFFLFSLRLKSVKRCFVFDRQSNPTTKTSTFIVGDLRRLS